MKAVIFVAILLTAPFAAMANDPAYTALRVVGKSRGEESLKHVVELRGRLGVPQPSVWKIVLDDPHARGGIRELEVQNGKIVGERTPLDAHIRLANPRTAESQANLILRRPYNYSRGVSKSGQLDMGLLFICFQADLQNGFVAVQKRLNGEPLEEYIKPVGGGFFFALPGVPAKGSYLGQSLMEATELPGDSAHSPPRKSS